MNETQSMNWNSTEDFNLIENEQELREQLIQRATIRLRQRTLEKGLQDILHKVVSLQTELESLRLDTVITLDTVSSIEDSKLPQDQQKFSRQLDILEKRYQQHKSILFQHQNKAPKVKKSDSYSNSDSSSVSRHSVISSLFGRYSFGGSSQTSFDQQELVEENNLFYNLSNLKDDDQISQIESISNPECWRQGQELNDCLFFNLSRKNSMDSISRISTQEQSTHLKDVRIRRRQRRQRYKENTTDSILPLSDLNENQNSVFYQHPLSPSITETMYPNLSNNSSAIDLKSYETIYSDRNVLDEAMSFLDDLSEGGDDGGFSEDFYLLLENPDLCCKPLSEIEPTMKQLRQRNKIIILFWLIIHLLKPTTWIRWFFKYSGMALFYIACSGLEWIRFLCILSGAVIISLLKGPDDLKRSL